MANPAKQIVKKFGGTKALAKVAGVDPSRVLRWTYPKERGGTGGRIPHWHEDAILAAARAQGIDLSHADFLPAQEAAE